MTRILTLLLAALLSGVLGSAERTVLCYGDSITFGEMKDQGVGAGTRWVDVLAKEVPGIRTVNAGKNGRTTEDLGSLEKAITAQPDCAVIILMLGTNDMKNAKDAAKAVADCSARMGKLIDAAQAKAPKAEILVCAPISIGLETLSDYWRGKGFGEGTQRALAQLPEAYAAEAKKRKVRFASMFAAVSAANLPDGVHPNLAGHGELAKAMAAALKAK